MSNPQLILDYASPRSRRVGRLPAESRIRIASDGGSTTITESLKGRGTAVAAIVFAAIVLIILLCTIVWQIDFWRHNRKVGPAAPVILIGIWLTEATVGIFVLDQTYRTTVIRVGNGEMTLAFSSLFSPPRQHRWPSEELGELRIESTQSGPGVTPLAELQIRPAHDIWIHLFTDHRELEVRQIAIVIARAINGLHDAPAGAVPTIALPDGATLDQLLHRHRALREADRARQIGSPRQG